MSVDDTPRLQLGQMADAQELDAMAVNDALLALDAFTGVRAVSRSIAAPPSSPADGDIYLLAVTPTGAWSGHGGALAYCLDGGWRYYAPFAGLGLLVADESRLLLYDGSAWQDQASLMVFQNLALLGINTSADAVNRLAVKSAALLFDNTGAGVQAKLNKHAAADTASLLYQTGYSGRAEMGLTGDDDFHLKVSPDGSTWTTALSVNRGNGYIGLQGIADAALTLNSTGTASITTPSSTVGFRTVSLNTTSGRLWQQEVYGGTPVIATTRIQGTPAAPTAMTSGLQLGGFSYGGWDGVGVGNAGYFRMAADENWSSTAHGGRFEIGAARNGAVLQTVIATFFGDGRIMPTGAYVDLSYSYQAPASGFAITVADNCGQLILNPAATLASGALTMPAAPKDGQRLGIAAAKAITALTHNANSGQSLNGSLTTLPAGGFAAYVFVASAAAWFRIG